MSGKKIIDGLKEAVEIARGDAPVAVVHHWIDRWQPIATAPKDEPFIGGTFENRKLVSGPRLFWWSKVSERYLAEGFHWKDATHWIPLPTPPQSP